MKKMQKTFNRVAIVGAVVAAAFGTSEIVTHTKSAGYKSKIETNIKKELGLSKFDCSAFKAGKDNKNFFVDILGEATNKNDSREFVSVTYSVGENLYQTIFDRVSVLLKYQDGKIVGADYETNGLFASRTERDILDNLAFVTESAPQKITTMSTLSSEQDDLLQF